METRKRAWAYYSIDAPEDERGALKGQRSQVVEYAQQMGFELVGSSSDMGREPLWNRTGFRRFVEAVTKDEVNILVVADRRCLTHSFMQMAQLKALAESCGLQVYSPLTGSMELL